MKIDRSTRSARSITMLVVVPISITLLNSYPVTPSESGAAYAALDSDTVGIYGSLLVTRSATQAVKAMNSGQWGEAQGEYSKLIAMRPKEEDFYFGLYVTSHHLAQWDQVMRALEGLFELRPDYKEQMTLEYGEALYHLNRYDDAEVYLKKALAHVNDESFVAKRLKRVKEKGTVEYTPVIGKIAKSIDTSVPAPDKYVFTHMNPRDVLTLENAYLKSEAILLCTYKDYEKDGTPITFYKPPKAIFHIDEELKTSSHFNPTLAIRFEFHNDIKDDPLEEKPKGWKFSDALMPKKGSKWIIFIPNAVPVERGMYKTYHGKFGIVEANEENYDKVLKIIKAHQGQS